MKFNIFLFGDVNINEKKFFMGVYNGNYLYFFLIWDNLELFV